MMEGSGVAITARTAWDQLSALGGFELEGRDADLELAILEKLPGSFSSLDRAIDTITVDQLVRALFQAAAPYAAMFNDILRYFREAGATKGRQHWEIKLEEEHIDLKDFEQFREMWSADVEMEAAALRKFDAFEISRAVRVGLFKHLKESPGTFRYSDDADPERRALEGPFGIPGVDHWLEEWKLGNNLPFPQELHPQQLPAALHELAVPAFVIGNFAYRAWPRQQKLRDEYASLRRARATNEDGYSRGWINQNETDYWVEQAIRLLGYASMRPQPELDEVEAELAKAVAAFPRRSFPISGSLEMLGGIFALPVWKERHALYAVWIATEITGAAQEQKLDLHHDNGVIAFAFKSTKLATFPRLEPVRSLYSEHKVPLENGIGDPPPQHAQPDYSLWDGEGEDQRCSLVVEVKHYKRAARRRFSEVMSNYANAHPHALIALASHGPTGDPTRNVEPTLAARFRALPGLTADNDERREELRSLVRTALGLPEQPGLVESSDHAVVIDVSGSMQHLLATEEFDRYFASRKTDMKTVAVFAVDDAVQFEGNQETSTSTILRHVPGGGTALVEPVRTIGKRYAHVTVVTDLDGVEDLARTFSVLSVERHRGGFLIALIKADNLLSNER